MQKQPHIIIIGGGLVGMTLALAMKDLPVQITLIEAKPKREYKPGQGKAIALNYASQQLLNNLNVWSSLQAGSTPINVTF